MDEKNNHGKVKRMSSYGRNCNKSQTYADSVKTGHDDKAQLDIAAGDCEDKERDDEEEFVECDKGRQCEPCLYDNEDKKGVAFCVVCIEYLCENCARDHRKSRMTRGHKVLDDKEMPADSSTFRTIKSLMSCPEHTDMPVKYRCEQHASFICSSCSVVSHRKCEDVREIPNEISIADTDAKPVSDPLNSLIDQTVSLRKRKQVNLKQLHKSEANLKSEQIKVIDTLRKHLVRLGEKAEEETRTLIQKEIVELEKGVRECKKNETIEKEYKELLDVANRYGSVVEQTVISDHISKETKNLKVKLDEQIKEEHVTVGFKTSRAFEDISSIGDVFVTRNSQFVESQPEGTGTSSGNRPSIEHSSDTLEPIKLSTELSIPESRPLATSSVKKCLTIHDISHPGSGPVGSFTRVLVLRDGRILVSDYTNNVIKILKPDFTVDFNTTLKGKPIDVYQTADKGLVIIFEDKRVVTRYIIGSTSIVEAGHFNTKLFPQSIAMSQGSDEIIILFSKEDNDRSSSSDGHVLIQTRFLHNGEHVKQVSSLNNTSMSSHELEGTCRIRVLSNSKNTLLISEKLTRDCFNIDKASNLKGKVYKKCKDNLVVAMSDIAIDKAGNIYICVKKTRGIVQISGRNFMNNRVLLTVPGVPLSVCIDDDRRLLLVGCENDNFIYVASFE